MTWLFLRRTQGPLNAYLASEKDAAKHIQRRQPHDETTQRIRAHPVAILARTCIRS